MHAHVYAKLEGMDGSPQDPPPIARRERRGSERGEAERGSGKERRRQREIKSRGAESGTMAKRRGAGSEKRQAFGCGSTQGAGTSRSLNT